MMYLDQSTPKVVDAERNLLVIRQTLGLTTDERGVANDEKLTAVVRSIGAPMQVEGFSLSSFEGTRAESVLNAVRLSMDPDTYGVRVFTPGNHGVVLAGHTRTGKTTFAVAALRRAVRRQFAARFVDFETLSKFFTRKIELSQNANAYDDYAERMDEWHTELWRMSMVYEYLVIDDLGRSKVPEFVYDEIHSMIRLRVANGGYTIITANMSMDDLAVKVNESLAHFLRTEFIVRGFSPEHVVV